MRISIRSFFNAVRQPGLALLFLGWSVFPSAAKPLVAEDLFRESLIPNVHLQLSPEALSSLSQRPRRYVRATVREGVKVYTNVAVRLKGGPGSFRQLQDKPAFTLNFEKFAEGQTFHGLKKIHLNNSVQDSSYLHEKLSRELFEAAGVPVPRAGNAWVNLNDREMGLYVLLEGVNKQFLKRYFKDVSGNVYDGYSGSDVTVRLPVNSGESPTDDSALRALAAAAREPDLEARFAALQKTLDLDRFYSFVAMEMILGHWDGYCMNRNNWRIYNDKDHDRMVFIPHGMDQVLGRNYSPFPQPVVGLVTRSLFEIPEARKQYRERFGQLATNVFLAGPLTDRVQDVGAKIDAVLAKHDTLQSEEHHKSVARLCRKISERATQLGNQLTPVEPIRFSEQGSTVLTQWTSKLDAGEAQIDREKNSDGKPLLHISTKNGCTASWRTACPLPQGQYRFQGRIKTKDVVLPKGDQRAGAGLRISRHREGQKNSGDHDWMPVSFDFQVQEDQREVELVCELRASEGEIWYELESLTLIRK